MIKKYIVCSLVLIMASVAWSAKGPRASGIVLSEKKTPIIGAKEEVSTNQLPAVFRRPERSSLDVVGEAYVAGTTWYDYQHNGTIGRMIGVDDMGFVHVTWMNGTTQDLAGPREAYYNCWDPATSDWRVEIAEGGVQANAVRAGYVSNAVTSSGFSFPSYHSTPAGETSLASHSSIDFLGGYGAFTAFSTGVFPVGEQVLWPKVAMDDNGILHGVSTGDGEPWQNDYYWRAIPFYVDGFGDRIEYTTFNNGNAYQMLGTGTVISADVAASPVSERVAVAFNESQGGTEGTIYTQINNDLMLVVSDDNGMTFAPPVDITEWTRPDMDCASRDTMACNGDTIRPYACLDVEFDYQDVVHVAFTTRTLYLYGWPSSDGVAGSAPDTTHDINLSTIWHWDSYTNEFSCIFDWNTYATFSNGDSFLVDNAWQTMVQRPSMAFDTATGWMYCAFVMHDSTQYSAVHNMSADIWVAASCNNGRTWYEPINVTETVTPTNAGPGESFHEREPSLNKLVTYEDGESYLHLEYVLDFDPGALPQPDDGGTPTLNDVYYQRIPLSALTWGQMRDWSAPMMHVDGRQHTGTGAIPFDPQNPCAGSAVGHDNALPTAFQLFQNYPNPFNPTTNIQFDLVNASKVSLKVYNVLGEAVATLVDGEALSAGAHTYSFDGANLSSGVYMYRLEANGVSSTRKMVLMK